MALATKGRLSESLNGVTRRLGFRHYEENFVRTICFLSAAVSIIATVGIVTILVTETIPFFQKNSLLAFLTGTEWAPNNSTPLYGVLPLVAGTLLVTLGSGMVSIPLGLLVGIYLSEYAHPTVRKILKPVLEILAGIPSVVFGYFALNLVTPGLQGFTAKLGEAIPALKVLMPEFSPANASAAAIVVGFMTLPMVASLCEDAISSVPKVMREAAYGLGCTKAEVIAKIVVPAAISGIVASFILALSRAIGETMAVTIAAGASPVMPKGIGSEVMTMTAQIVNYSKGDISRGDPKYQSIFAIGLLLFVVTLLMNLMAQAFVRRMGRHAR